MWAIALGEGRKWHFHQPDVAFPKTESGHAVRVRVKLMLNLRRAEGIDEVLSHGIFRERAEYGQVISADQVWNVLSYKRRNADVVVLFRVLGNDDVASKETAPFHLAVGRRGRHEVQPLDDEGVAVDVHVVAETDGSFAGLGLLVNAA